MYSTSLPPPQNTAGAPYSYQQYLDMYAALNPSAPQAGPSASTSAVAAAAPVQQPAPAPGRHRLPHAALAMIKEWWAHEPNPTTRQRREMVAQIHQLFPEASWYSLNSLNSWIQNRKQAERRQSGKMEKKDTASILWPTLTRDKIEQLRTLRRDKPAALPLQPFVRLWATALGVPEPHVEAWLHYNPEEPREDDASSPQDRKPTLHLPTPEATASPEPSHAHAVQSPSTTSVQSPTHASQTQATVKQQPYSPVQTHFIPFFPPSAVVQAQQAPVHSPTDPRFNTIQRVGAPIQYIPPGNHHPLQPQPPTLPPFAQQPAQPQPKPKVQIAIPHAQAPQPSQSPQTTPEPSTPALVQAITKGLSMSLKAGLSDIPEVTITSLEDFDRAFEPFGRMARELLSRARQGAFAPIGLPAEMPELAGSADLGIDIDGMQVDRE